MLRAHAEPFSTRRIATLAGVVAMLGCADADSTSGSAGDIPEWTVDAAPALVLGADADDTTQAFERIVGATRLPDGGILVADWTPPALHHFDAEGRLLRRFGRAGSGPGEFRRASRLFRCGDSIAVYDIDGYRTSVWSLGGEHVRTFRFGGPPGQTTPYLSSCNRDGTFAHFGWEQGLGPGDRIYRGSVPFWIGGMDSTVRAVIGEYPGSERMLALHPQTGQPVGSGPRRFGKQTSLALASDRLYVGTAERNEIVVLGLDGVRIGSVALQGRTSCSAASWIRTRRFRRCGCTATAGAEAHFALGAFATGRWQRCTRKFLQRPLHS